MMKVLVINDVAGRLDQLQAVLAATAGQSIGAVLLLGNLVVTTERQQAAALEAAVGDLPPSLVNALEDELAAQNSVYASVLALLGASDVPVYVIPGAYDDLAALDAVRAHYQGYAPILSVHGTAATMGADTVVTGLGGAIAPPAGAWTILSYSAEDPVRAFEHTFRVHCKTCKMPHHIFLFATPYAVPSVIGGDHNTAGQLAITAVIHRYQPQWVFCGGPASQQLSMELDSTYVVNPGAVQHGQYAVIDLERRNVQLLSLANTNPSMRPTVLVGEV